MLPQAREEKLSVHELAEETLVSDLQWRKVHALNPIAALIWRHCDGKTSVPELARLLPAELQVKGGLEVVQLALQQLGRRQLLMETPPPPSESARVSRRDALKKLAIAAVSLPIVMTVTTRFAKAATDIGGSKICPNGTTECSYFNLAKVCCNNATETCIDSQCFAKQASGPPCLPIGNPCTKGQLCCKKGGGTTPCPLPGGTC
jgi:Coenzyme PQQ synthesis protein D (PqqD)